MRCWLIAFRYILNHFVSLSVELIELLEIYTHVR